jgi:SAM-dependent methyltransferase
MEGQMRSLMKRLKTAGRRSPGLYNFASLVRFLLEEAWFAGWVWIAPKKFMDESNLKRSWNFEAPDAQEWHNRVLAVIAAQIGREHWGEVLEIGCSDGVFTSYLASRCRSVEAYDISPAACIHAAERCAQYPNVRIELLDLAKDEIRGKYDLVFAMDVLSCIRGRKRLEKATDKLISALREGGILIYTDNSMPLDVLRFWGNHRWWSSFLAMMEPDDCVRFLERRFNLQLVSREQYLPDLQGGRDQLIALLRKGPAPSSKDGVKSVEHLVTSVTPPAWYT